ncbi:MAG TPA: hypothetical protein VFB62_15690, partial [Polyangiaceae bacterium]|nr:hypothetical protein [Polyangiaceae bacterium]
MFHLTLYRTVFVVTLTLTWFTTSYAQNDEPTAGELSTARQLFSEGIAAERAQRWEDALKLFRKVATIAPSPVVRFHVGLNAEKTGHWVEGVNAFQLAVRDANKKGDDEVASKAAAELERLQPRVPRVVINVPDDAADLSIEIDGKPVRASLAGTPVFVDPGGRRIVVRAKNYDKASEHTVNAVEGGTETIDTDLGNKVELAAAEASGAAPSAAKTESSDSVSSPSASQSFIPLGIAIGVTAALTVAAVATGIVAHNQIQDYEEANANPAPGSLAEREEMRDDAVTMSWVSTGLTGGAIVGAGVTLALVILRFTSADAEAPAEEA